MNKVIIEIYSVSFLGKKNQNRCIQLPSAKSQVISASLHFKQIDLFEFLLLIIVSSIFVDLCFIFIYRTIISDTKQITPNVDFDVNFYFYSICAISIPHQTKESLVSQFFFCQSHLDRWKRSYFYYIETQVFR
ncbi:hypothetical protein SSS_08750 [Sarcoptes scabiei]|nr:hypothetical protein SSS_08750 [Sarcoptes scabiei]UXI19252.1 chitosanase [Sarcoptes scabiei]